MVTSRFRIPYVGQGLARFHIKNKCRCIKNLIGLQSELMGLAALGHRHVLALTGDPSKFGDIVGGQYTPPVAPFVDDKESSGVIDVTDLFKDAPWFRPNARVLLLVVQAHFAYDLALPAGAQLVEGGQLLLMVKAG